MNNLSIAIDHFSSNPDVLEKNEIAAFHAKKAEDHLTKIFQKNKIAPQENLSDIQLKFDTPAPRLFIKNEEVPLEKTKEIKKLGKIIRYYQHIDQLPRRIFSSEEQKEVIEATKRSVKEIREASVPGTDGKILAGLRLADDTLSLVRNIMFAIPSIGPNDPIASHLGYYGGAFWTFSGIREMDEGYIDYKRAEKISDSEGKRRAEVRILSGGVVSAGSLAYLGGKICDTLSMSAVSAPLLNAANGFFGLGSAIAMGASALGSIRCHRFSQRLNAYFENPHLTQMEKMKGALRFLRDLISVTPEEKDAILREIEKEWPKASQEEKKNQFEKKLLDLTEAKVKYVKRRTSGKSLQLIITHVDQILAKIENQKTHFEGMKEGTALIGKVQKESGTKKTLYNLSFVAALLSFVGMLILAFSATSVAAFVLFGVAGGIYLSITIYAVLGVFNKKDKNLFTTDPIQHISQIAAL